MKTPFAPPPAWRALQQEADGCGHHHQSKAAQSKPCRWVLHAWSPEHLTCNVAWLQGLPGPFLRGDSPSLRLHSSPEPLGQLPGGMLVDDPDSRVLAEWQQVLRARQEAAHAVEAANVCPAASLFMPCSTPHTECACW